PLYERLSRTFGQGESATIAIADRMGLSAALDDRAAQRACDRLNPPVMWLATEEILSIAVREGLMSRVQAEAIWLATDVRDPSRQIL
ncbi:MAG: hypothetical protein ACYCYF_13230, partial [Anaerolineae bacterium]